MFCIGLEQKRHLVSDRDIYLCVSVTITCYAKIRISDVM